MKKQANAIHIRTWRRGLALCPCCGGIAQFKFEDLRVYADDAPDWINTVECTQCGLTYPGWHTPYRDVVGGWNQRSGRTTLSTAWGAAVTFCTRCGALSALKIRINGKKTKKESKK